MAQRSKSAKPATGDFVVIWSRADERRPAIRRLTLNLPPWVKFPYRDHLESNVKAIVMFEQLNPPQKYTVSCDKIHAMHKVIGFVPDSVAVGAKIKAKDVSPIGGR